MTPAISIEDSHRLSNEINPHRCFLIPTYIGINIHSPSPSASPSKYIKLHLDRKSIEAINVHALHYIHRLCHYHSMSQSWSSTLLHSVNALPHRHKHITCILHKPMPDANSLPVHTTCSIEAKHVNPPLIGHLHAHDMYTYVR